MAMTVNPVFINELRQSAFRRRGGLVAAAIAIAGVILIVLASIEEGRVLVAYAPLVLLPLVVPAIASGAFAKEYEQQTWMDLYLTQLSNAQVVWGKFGAYVAQICGALLGVVPACCVILLAELGRVDLSHHGSTVARFWPLILGSLLASYLGKLVLSACLAIFLTMVCSRYSSNRRTALMWSYIAMALYTLLGYVVWSQVGMLEFRSDAEIARMSPGEWDWAHEALSMPGFMQSFHIIFCSVVGAGSIILMWVSLGEQRGYRGGKSDGGVTRAWQPIAKRREPAAE